jgi:hypothetical protein
VSCRLNGHSGNCRPGDSGGSEALVSWAPDRERRRCRHEECVVEDQTMDEGVETSISDELDSDLDLIAASKPKGSGYIEQEN